MAFLDRLKARFQRAKPAPVPLEEVQPEYRADMQASLTAYFNFHSVSADKPVPAGLTIPWVVLGSENGNDYDHTRGFLVATGEYSEQKHWPVFTAVTMRDNTGPFVQHTKLAMKP